MHTQAVDAQKHNSSVNVELFYSIKRRYNNIPDFMSEGKPLHKNQKVYESPGILGQLYRALNEDINVEELIDVEYNYKILRKYEMDENLLGNFNIRKFLAQIYETIVRPMANEIRHIMIDKNLTSETDLYNTSSEFSKLVSSNDEAVNVKQDIRGIIEDVRTKYKEILIKLQNRYLKSSRYRALKHKQGNHDIESSINDALKFATYYHREFYRKLSPEFRNNKYFRKFVSLISREKIFNPISIGSFKRIVTTKFCDSNEVSKVVNQSQIYSPYFLLSNY